MASNVIDVGTGTTLTLQTSTWDTGGGVLITDISWSGIAREAHSVNHMGIVAPGVNNFGNMEFIPSDLVDPGEVTISIYLKPETLPPINETTVAAPETLIVQWLNTADVAGATWTAEKAFCTSFEFGTPHDGVRTATATYKLSGDVAVSA